MYSCYIGHKRGHAETIYGKSDLSVYQDLRIFHRDKHVIHNTKGKFARNVHDQY